MTRLTRLLFVAASLCVAVPPAHAHKPSYGGMDVFGSPEEAYIVDEFDVSIVVYHEVTCRSEQLWLEYDAPEDDAPLYVQLGVPVIDRLESYRPSVAILAPGLPAPEGDLPFDVPEGFGVQVVATNDVVEPDSFYEPFSQTESWVVYEETVSVPAGIGYVVAWHPERATGKLWVATGTVEDFGPEDFAQMGDWMTLTKTFHEVAPYVPLTEPEETTCEDVGLDLPEQVDRAAAGCSAAGGGAAPWALMLMAAGLVTLRRRTHAGAQATDW